MTPQETEEHYELTEAPAKLRLLAQWLSITDRPGQSEAVQQDLLTWAKDVEQLLAERRRMQKQRELQRKGYRNAVTWLKEQISRHEVRQGQMQERIKKLEDAAKGYLAAYDEPARQGWGPDLYSLYSALDKLRQVLKEVDHANLG